MSDIDQKDAKAADKLLPMVYQELRKLAASKMANETPGHTLQPTALVHEAWLRLAGSDQRTWQNRGHFFGAAAEAMRRILIDSARRKRALRHGGDQKRVELEDADVASETKVDELLAMNEALEKFAVRDNEKANLVKLRYFAGLSFDEVAEALHISVPTAKRWWAYSRAWLYAEMAGQEVQRGRVNADGNG